MDFPSFDESQMANFCLNLLSDKLIKQLKSHIALMGHSHMPKEKKIAIALYKELSYNPKFAKLKNIINKSTYKCDNSLPDPYCKLATKFQNVV